MPMIWRMPSKTAMRMTDPTNALESFQAAFSKKDVAIQSCETDKDLFVFLDHPNGKPRFTYARIEGRTVTALVLFVLIEPMKGVPCFQIGYAVPNSHRRKGIAKNTVKAALNELTHGLSRTPMSEFYIEAIVGNNNDASNNIAASLISDQPTEIIDEFSKLPALQYVKKISGGQKY